MLQILKKNKNDAHLNFCIVTGHKVSAGEHSAVSHSSLRNTHTDRLGYSWLCTHTTCTFSNYLTFQKVRLSCPLMG